jgi:ABC-type transport system involved in Fe-S cluster assembly fused permease/ATPase subunit
MLRSSTTLQFFHYLTPLSLIVLATALSSILACFRPPSKRALLARSKRKTLSRLVLCVSTLYLTEGITFLCNTSHSGADSIYADKVLYVTLSAITWFAIFFILQEAQDVYKITTVASWAVFAVLESAVCALSIQHRLALGVLGYVQLAIQTVRICCLFLLCGLAVSPTPSALEVDAEREPLLKATLNYKALANDGYCATIINIGTDIEEDSVARPNEDGGLRKEHSERVERLGGWWAYLQQFQIFLPHILPTKSRRLQGYAIGVVLLLLCERVANLLGPRLAGDIVNNISSMRNTDEIPWRKILVYILAIHVLNNGVIVPLRSGLRVRLNYWSYGRILSASFAHVMGLSLEFHENKSTGEVMAAVRLAQTLSLFADQVFMDAIPLLLDMIVALAYLSYVFDVYFGLILICTYLIYVVVSYKFTGWGAKRRRKYLDTSVRQEQIFNQSISNWQIAAYFNRQAYQKSCLDTITQEEIVGMTKFADLSQITQVAQNLVLTLGYGAVLSLAAYQTTRRQQPVGDIVMLLLYWSTFTRPLNSLAASYASALNYAIDAERLLRLWQLQPTVRDIPGANDLQFDGGKVEFRNVRFSYNKEKEVIKGINFTVSPGSTVAFVGPTGSGKTTSLNKLLLRLYDVTGGSILVDGQDIRHVKQESLREAIGIVPQDPTFYNDTIVDILRYARPNVTVEEMQDVCKRAAIHDQILRLPQGYHSKVGERGVKLSGGEKQRLAIAQILLKDPKIIVLDEATSSVDNITESEIQDSFSRICKGRTTFVIAHRLSTVKNVDQIYVLDQGEIVEHGTHEELLRMRGKYHKLWTRKEMVDELKALTSTDPFADPDPSCGSNVPTTLVDFSVDAESSLNSFENTMQLDGQNSSKHMEGSNPQRACMDKKLYDLKERLGSIKLDLEEDLEVEESADETALLKMLSPTPTDFSPPHPPRKRSSLNLRRLSRDKRRSFSGPSDPCSSHEQDGSPTWPVQQNATSLPGETQPGDSAYRGSRVEPFAT